MDQKKLICQSKYCGLVLYKNDLKNEDKIDNILYKHDEKERDKINKLNANIKELQKLINRYEKREIDEIIES